MLYRVNIYSCKGERALSYEVREDYDALQSMLGHCAYPKAMRDVALRAIMAAEERPGERVPFRAMGLASMVGQPNSPRIVADVEVVE